MKVQFYWLPQSENQWHLYASIDGRTRHYVGNVTKKLDNFWIATIRPHYGIDYRPAGSIHTVSRWLQEATKEHSKQVEA